MEAESINSRVAAPVSTLDVVPTLAALAGIDLGEHAETAYDLVARGGRIGASGHGRPHDARHHGDETIDTDPTDTPTQGALA